ncbi:MAG: NADH:ubiquinone reductase (Na(+)-transporting) subunit B [Gemmatimonadetes bacterium]|nr:NADH:ubiquinone reductase (Na(+)-transporting) subunit B [Gemmatimonadota bacterium]
MLRRALDRIAPLFEPGRLLSWLQPLYEAADTALYSPGHVTRRAPHVRDAVDVKRIMGIVVIALIPCVLMALYNTGYQAQWAIANGAAPLDDWRTALYVGLGLPFDYANPLLCSIHGALYFVPALVVAFVTGIGVEVVFAKVRGHEVNEGFFVTGVLIPLILPPAIPLWQVAVGTAFGVVFAKEIFGGTGMNFLNPALVVRAFLFFAYPAEISGDAPWIAADFMGIDGFTGATWLAQASAIPGVLDGASWTAAFLGLVPGSMGETSALACLIGAALILGTRVGSWRVVAGVTLGTFLTVMLFNGIGSDTNPMFGVPFHWHVILGGWAFGTVYMATDPVTSAYTETGKWWYGIGIGVLCILVRVVNPAYPEGMMLAILFMNMFAPLIDHFVVRANIRRRAARSGA